MDIERVFNISKSTIIRDCKLFAEKGSDAFFKQRGFARRNSKALTKEIREKAAELLYAGFSRREVANEFGIKYYTLNKAIQQGRVKFEPSNENRSELSSSTNKSERSGLDALAGDGIGVACTRTSERILAQLPQGKKEHANFLRVYQKTGTTSRSHLFKNSNFLW